MGQPSVKSGGKELGHHVRQAHTEQAPFPWWCMEEGEVGLPSHRL